MYTMTGRELRAARILLGWSQADLAARAKVSRPTISGIEAGTLDPHMSTMTRIVDALRAAGVEIDKGTVRRVELVS